MKWFHRASPCYVAIRIRNEILRHREPVRLALFLGGEVGQLVEQVVRRGVSLLRPPHRANSLRVWVDRWVGGIWRESYILKAGVQTLQTVLTFLQRDCLKS